VRFGARRQTTSQVLSFVGAGDSVSRVDNAGRDKVPFGRDKSLALVVKKRVKWRVLGASRKAPMSRKHCSEVHRWRFSKSAVRNTTDMKLTLSKKHCCGKVFSMEKESTAAESWERNTAIKFRSCSKLETQAPYKRAKAWAWWHYL